MFLFTGQGSQYAGMGKGLFETSAVFRQSIKARARGTMDRPLFDLLFGSTKRPSTTPAQPALSLWINIGLRRSWGVVLISS
jgi:acyl transferase domain-containing protein